MNEIVKKNGIKYGVITGFLSILMTTLIYTIDLNLFTSIPIGLGMIAVYLIIGIVLVSKTKKELNGVISFKDAFTTYFISAVIGIAISVAFNILLFNVVDPEVKETLKELSIKSAVETMEKFGSPSEEISKAVEKLEKTNQFETLELIKGSVFSIVFSAIFGLILASIFKTKTNPNY